MVCSHCVPHLVLKSLSFFPNDLSHPARPYDLGSIFSQMTMTIWEARFQTHEPMGLILTLHISLGSASLSL